MVTTTATCDRECVDCGMKLLTGGRWRYLSLAARRWMWRNGYAGQGSVERCQRCHSRHERGYAGTNWRWVDLEAEVEFLISTGAGIAEISERLGLKQNSLARSFTRARKRGLTTRRIPYESEKSQHV